MIEELMRFLELSLDFFYRPMNPCMKFFFFFKTTESDESDFCSGTSSIYLLFFIAECSADNMFYFFIEFPSIILVTLLDIDMND